MTDLTQLKINRLYNGGLITNYYCSSKCRHCLYGSSPGWPKEYITKEMTRKILNKIKSLGINGIHIGGGEPFLNIPALYDVVKTASEEGITIEYIETNSSWFKNESESMKVFTQLKSLGIDTILISISPFHNEYVPFYKVKATIKACQKAGLNFFPWLREFYVDIDTMADHKIHNLNEYKQYFGDNYLKRVNQNFGLTLRGRALKTYQDIYQHRPLSAILSDQQGCLELSQTGHFHLDLFGNYIPGLCTGLAINYQNLGSKEIKPEKYPLITTLYQQGINGLYKLAITKYNFKPAETYLSKCHLCFKIRQFLLNHPEADYPELAPVDFYHQV